MVEDEDEMHVGESAVTDCTSSAAEKGTEQLPTKPLHGPAHNPNSKPKKKKSNNPFDLLAGL